MRKKQLRSGRIRLTVLDLVLIALTVAPLCTGVITVWSPTWWSWYVGILNMRYWSPWVWIGLVVAILELMLLLHLWPERRR